MTDTAQFTFASVPYANAAPLASCLPAVAPNVALLYDHPAKLLARLADRSADVAIIPVADFLAAPGLVRLADLGICADGLVRSVLLKCSKPLASLCTVQADPASRTSNALTRVLLEHRFRLSVRMTSEPADAQVVIGDRALVLPPAPCGDYDLAAEWKTLTDLPFVFAVWACRADHPDLETLTRIALAARDAGLAAVPQLAAQWADRLALPFDTVHEYLTRIIYYRVGPRESAAIERFRRYLDDTTIA